MKPKTKVLSKLKDVASRPPAPACWTAPSDIPPDVARKILAVRDALIADDYREAWHQLYAIADPTFESYEPWKFLEKQSNESR